MTAHLSQTLRDAFTYKRGASIEAYAGVEQALCLVISGLMGVGHDVAASIFFRVVNSKARNQILEDLLKQRIPETDTLKYWFGTPGSRNKKGLITYINQIDSRRNEIVHWHILHNINYEDNDSLSYDIYLTRPIFWMNSNSKPIRMGEMDKFIAQCEFIHHSLTMFYVTQFPKSISSPPSPKLDAWRDIFRQLCVYPPPSTHPVWSMLSAHRRPPQPSEV